MKFTDWSVSIKNTPNKIHLILEKEGNRREYSILISGFINEKLEIKEKIYDLNKLLYNFNENDLNFIPVRISNEIEEFFVSGVRNPNFKLNVRRENDYWYITGIIKYYPRNKDEIYEIIKKETGIDLKELNI